MSKEPCSVPNCGRPEQARKLCAKHYADAKRDGTLPAGRKLTPEERRVRKNERSQRLAAEQPKVRKQYTAAERQERQRTRQRERLGIPTPAHPTPTECECCGRREPKSLAADHCHRTGIPRGWLCSRCNGALGLLGDDIAGIEQMRSYLLKYSAFAWMEDGGSLRAPGLPPQPKRREPPTPSERAAAIRWGIANARYHGTRSGKPIGRPAVAAARSVEVRALRSQGLSLAAIAERVGLSFGSVQRLLAAAPGAKP